MSWVIEALLRDNLTPVNTAEAFESSISECYPETTRVGWLELDTASILKEMDPTSWRIAESEWADSELDAGQIMTFDNGSTYFWTREVEDFLDQAESEDNAT